MKFSEIPSVMVNYAIKAAGWSVSTAGSALSKTGQFCGRTISHITPRNIIECSAIALCIPVVKMATDPVFDKIIPLRKRITASGQEKRSDEELIPSFLKKTIRLGTELIITTAIVRTASSYIFSHK